MAVASLQLVPSAHDCPAVQFREVVVPRVRLPGPRWNSCQLLEEVSLSPYPFGVAAGEAPASRARQGVPGRCGRRAGRGVPGVPGQVGQERIEADQVRVDLLPVRSREQVPADHGFFLGTEQPGRDGRARLARRRPAGPG